jgi:subtilisin family serine protease
MRLESWSARSVLAALGLLLLASLTAVAGSSAAPIPAQPEAGLVSTSWKPGLLRAALTTVVVELAGDPVSVQEDNAGRRFNRDEKRAAKGALENQQDSLRGSIAALGGKVLGDYQTAYNGIKVSIDGRKLEELAALPNVVGVHGLMKMDPVRPDNVNGVQLIGAPAAWASAGTYRGEGIKVAILDTGIDYTHANFGGPGTPAAFASADSTDTDPANPLWFGPTAFTKVKGGIDLVGDDYDASADPGSPALIPHPDPNPLDCNGHGSHVAGSAAGYGVKSDGSTYTGAYDASTYSNAFRIGPGAAPKADLYAVRVFGCEGSTDVTVDAIEWAVENDMDVINMSLGSSFGRSDDPSAKAATNAARAGLIVVASAGNSGPSQYITGSPASGAGAISVAANDANQSFPGAQIALNTGATLTAINANGATAFPAGATGLVVVREADGSISRGCEGVGAGGDPVPGSAAGEFAAAGASGKIAVVRRGDCARVAKAVNGQKAGAVAVIMINNADVLPPFEGEITSNPDTGEEYTVTIPFLGVKQSDGAAFTAAATSATITQVSLGNPNYTGFASFSSGGPTNGTSALKPDITAPGTSVISTASGTGNGAAIISGTSMAAPHVAGVAALVKQAHSSWRKGEDLKAAIVNTGNPAGVLDNRISRGGTGLVQPFAATQTSAVAIGDRGTGSLSFGFEELRSDYRAEKEIEVRNHGSAPITFTVATANAAGSPHSVELERTSVTVGPGDEEELDVKLLVPVATAGDASAFQEVAGYVTLTPAAGQNNGVVLRVPYYLVPRALSSVRASSQSLRRGATSATVNLSNRGPIAGSADFYTWGLSDRNERGKGSFDVRAVGVQSFPNPSTLDANRRLMVFAINTHDRWSHPSLNEFDIAVDVDNNGSTDYIIVGIDRGALGGSFDGVFTTAVVSTRSPQLTTLIADAPTDGSAALLFVRSTQLCRGDNPLTPAVDPEPCLSKTANPRFTYALTSFDLESGGVDEVDGTAKFNPWNPSIESGQFEPVAPGASVSVPAAIDRTEYALSPAKGLMAVVTDNKSGEDEAQLLELKIR